MIHIMVSFSEYQNSILIDRVPYKQKSCFFSLKISKITTPLQVTRWNIQNPALKKDTPSFSMRMDLNRD